MGVRFAAWGLIVLALLSVPSAMAWPRAAGAPFFPIWPNDVPISVAPGEQGVANYGRPGVSSAPDGFGGAFLLWESRGNGTIYAQRVDAAGQPLWPANGIQVAPGAWYEAGAGIMADGQGGAIVGWVDGRNGICFLSFAAECDIYAQRISSSGNRLWGDSGVPVTIASMNQGISGIGMTTDGAGGAILAWEDARPPACCRYFAQRIDATGQPVWTTDGIPVSPPPTIVIGPVGAPPLVVSDASGGAYVTWLNHQVNPVTELPTLNVQHLSPGGQLLWVAGGLPIGFPSRYLFAGASDGAGGVLAAWPSQGPDGWDDIYVQRLDTTGQKLWPSGGVPVVTAKFPQINPQVVGDGAGGAIVSWQDDRNETDTFGCFGLVGNCDIYAQRIGANGQALWTVNGVPISLAPNNQFSSRLVSDGAGGAIIAWQDCREHPSLDSCVSGMHLYTQHVDGLGKVLGARNGQAVSASPGNQGVHYGSDLTSSFAMVSDSAGGAILAWPDGRNAYCASTNFITGCELFAQRVGAASAYTSGAFFTLAPCRLVDTRASPGVPLFAGQDRTFTLAGDCGVPASAIAVSVNIAVTGPTANGYLRIYPSDVGAPVTSAINYSVGQTRSNNAILTVSQSGQVSVRSGQAFGTVHFILDVNGYFE